MLRAADQHMGPDRPLAASAPRERSTDRFASRFEPVWGCDLTVSTDHGGD